MDLLLGDFACGLDFAADVALREAGVERAGVEVLAGCLQGKFLVLEEFQLACQFNFAAVVGFDAAVF